MSSSPPTLKIDWCDVKAATFAVEHWHYSHTMPNGKVVRFGVWEDGRFRGVVLFGDGANKDLMKPYGLKYEEGCELVRIALASHATPVSRIVAIALKLLKKEFPTLRCVASFADPEQGHHGGIYQAGGWIYAGRSNAADEYIVKGKRVHGRALRSNKERHPLKALTTLQWAKAVLDPNACVIKGSSKYRYLMPLDSETRKRLECLAKPYPKRERKTAGGRSSPLERGGSSPTRSLQSKEPAS